MTLEDIKKAITYGTNRVSLTEATIIRAQLLLTASVTVPNEANKLLALPQRNDLHDSLQREILSVLYIDRRREFAKLAMNLLNSDPYTHDFKTKLELLVTTATSLPPL